MTQQKWMYTLGFILLLILGFYFYRKYKIAPDLTVSALPLTSLDGEAVKLDDLRGKKTLICFGASWCGPCRQEMKLMQAIRTTVLKDVRVIFISDEPLETVQKMYEASRYDFEWLKLEQTFSAIGINSIPTSYLLNTGGRVVKQTVGYIDWEDPSTARHLLKIME